MDIYAILLIVLAIIIILIPLTACIRLLGCLFSSHCRSLVKRHPIIHAIWASLALFMIVFIILPFSSYHSNRWPKIENPGTFHQECINLIESNKKKEIKLDKYGCLDKEMFPPEIRKVKPACVCIYNDKVEILISGGGIGAGWGYVVGYNIKENKYTWPSKYKDIYRYETEG